MARIHYGLAGEGRGHAARARSLLDALRERHSLVVHAPGDAYELLAPLYGRDPRVEVRPAAGLRWAYDRAGRVAYVRSAAVSARYLWGLPRRVTALARQLVRERADLVISDFEPALSRAARCAGVPLVAVDHQAFLTTSDFSDLPLRLRCHAAFIGAFVARWGPRPDHRVVSSFHLPAPRAGLPDEVRRAGVFLRAALRDARPTRGGFLLAYLRPGTPRRALEVLTRAPLPVRAYGLAGGGRDGQVEHRPVSESAFVADLAACEAVVTTAGNQLLGEALALGKPVLAAPEPGNREQELNAWYLGRAPGGRATTFARFDDAALRAFLAERDALAAAARARPHEDGVHAAVAAVEAALAARPALRVGGAPGALRVGAAAARTRRRPAAPFAPTPTTPA